MCQCGTNSPEAQILIPQTLEHKTTVLESLQPFCRDHTNIPWGNLMDIRIEAN
jgi:CTP-dependent riboflavin kinase